MNVLLVDDDPDFLLFTTAALEDAGMRYESAHSAEQGLAVLDEQPAGTFDLILLDVQMPGAPGWDVLTEMREKGDETPVVFVTGNEALADRVKGLRLGADDYVVKPIEYEELIARIEAVVRRRREMSPLVFGDLTLDLARRKADRGGARIALSPREYDLLFTLVEARGEILSRDQLLQKVWDIPFDPETNVVEVHIGRVRKKVDRHGRPMIETVRGEGYRAVAR